MMKNYDKNLTFWSMNKNQMKINDLYWKRSSQNDILLTYLNCTRRTCCKLVYTCCTSHKTFKKVNGWEKKKSIWIDLKKCDDTKARSTLCVFLCAYT